MTQLTPCPTCGQYSHSLGDDAITEAFNHFHSTYVRPVRSHLMVDVFDAKTRNAAQVLMAAAREKAVMTELTQADLVERVVEQIVVKMSDWSILLLDIDEGSPILSRVCDEMRIEVRKALAAIPVPVINDAKLLDVCHSLQEDFSILRTQLAAKDQEIAELRKWRTEQDCRYTMGRVADISAAHCPLGDPCERCAKDAEIARLTKAMRYILPYLKWTISDESPGHHPTLPSAVDAFRAALKGPSDVG